MPQRFCTVKWGIMRMYVQFEHGEVTPYSKVYEPEEALLMYNEIRTWSMDGTAPDMSAYVESEDTED